MNILTVHALGSSMYAYGCTLEVAYGVWKIGKLDELLCRGCFKVAVTEEAVQDKNVVARRECHLRRQRGSFILVRCGVWEHYVLVKKMMALVSSSPRAIQQNDVACRLNDPHKNDLSEAASWSTFKIQEDRTGLHLLKGCHIMVVKGLITG